MACADVGRLSAALIASSPRKRRFSHRHAIRRLPLGDIAGRSLHYIVHGKGERWVELTLHQSGGLQGRRDDRAGCNARCCAGRRCGNLRNRETCGLEGRRDHDVRVERIALAELTEGKRRMAAAAPDENRPEIKFAAPGGLTCRAVAAPRPEGL